ncbi:hypothetical protein B4U80_13250 [Leptotrombidium deliense]|uniref:DRBM domain-containing protein n=1 Tax=Leptotrombidium deliense TaxID=299467 RepID=A0A443S9M9_9ACAR|nr:hypothetical protein B4U80_13250 [Leptotrombidium deliense]
MTLHREFWKSPEVVNENEDYNTNAVGDLLALCVKLKIGAPQFEDSDLITKKKSFVVTCTICEFNGLKSEGEGPKKQIAKREAALKMIEILSNLEVKRTKQAFMFEEKYTDFEEGNEVEDGADETVIRNFVSKLNGSLKRSECQLQSPNVDNIPEFGEPLIDYCEQLKKWSAKNDLKFEYLRIPSISKSYRHQCLLKIYENNNSINDSPKLTVWGTTNAACILGNYNAAMQDAARRVLFFVENNKETYEAFDGEKLGDNIRS